ncbi:CRISPR-associated primase-polymerase type B [Porphyromonas levii]|uniref:CRISPR-associated primase-polymerase type B n=1 Tax=Porphyromonas levii TaxID=28114 RepID=UPI001B8C8A64|nr:CRISPR-associated primase-polymerase type B [Porphyromonas levii]MBR8713716.1 hypothetical protein [Porphyromonas levii]MBR8715718.1 hypothetical protein [Porphyromonas levii]MBR8728277.1 hypothetical protein [Porphyromonas levii]MBR8736381.1 hypothetical protein [Porphyromonas levii]MBR8778660.1 hypothetical protein [Porphyromonas levii]
MLHAGSHIATSGDPLSKVPLDYLYHSIKNPKPHILNRIKQLRAVRNIDPKQYSLLKRDLPYIVCGAFNPAVRRTENFAFTSYFIIDIDHVAEKGLELTALREKIEADSRVLLSFVSPSADGLKLLFHLSERCYDAGVFSLFYKLFVRDFSIQYGLDQVVDSKTSDVTRACFISYDPEVYYNPEATPVDLGALVDSRNPYMMFGEKKRLEEDEKCREEEQEKSATPKGDVDQEVMQRIKEILGKVPPKPDKPAPYVPEQLNMIMTELSTYISETGLIVDEVINISYGKKIRASVGTNKAEINLFFGKRGYSVVQSPRTGTSAELNEALAKMVESFVYNRI